MQHPPISNTYLPHIDGLRALAVLSVLFFHFELPGFSGGFVGVDVFFVISGYLITRIIISEIEATGSFSYITFYKRRIRRLFPALLFVLAGTSIAAILVLTPDNLSQYGLSLLTSALSVSNYLFWAQSGYFDSASNLKPLLHTWSLSVEEQFYLVWPTILVVFMRPKLRISIIATVCSLGLGSLYLNYLYVKSGNPDFASTIFFLAPFRVFEFAIGAIATLIEKKIPTKVLTHEFVFAAGLGLIIYSISTFNQTTVFPYFNALIPCLGAFLIILAKNSKRIGYTLTNPPAVFFGLISYSLYLIHWPVLVFAKYLLYTITPSIAFVMLAGSICAAWISYALIEIPFRKRTILKKEKVFFASSAFGMFAAVFLGLAIGKSDGWVWRYAAFGGHLIGSVTITKATHDEGETQPVSTEPDEITGSKFTGATAEEKKVVSQGIQQPEKQVAKVLPVDIPRPTKSAEPAKPTVSVPLTATEIENGKYRRYTDIHGACNMLELNNSKRCHLDRRHQILVLGNSHEPDAFNMFNFMYKTESSINFINFGTINDCAYEVTGDSITSSTEALNCSKRFMTLNDDEFLSRLDYIVYSTHKGFEAFAKDGWKILSALQARNKKIEIIVIGSYLETKIECATIYNKTLSFDSCKAPFFVTYFSPDERKLSQIPEVRTLRYVYINKYKLLCKSSELESCLTFANGEPMYYDSHHLSYGFAQYVGKLISEQYGSELQSIGLPAPTPQKLLSRGQSY